MTTAVYGNDEPVEAQEPAEVRCSGCGRVGVSMRDCDCPIELL